MGSSANYDVVHRGNVLNSIIPGKWIFFQRAKIYGGGWWFGRAYDDCFVFEFPYPTSLREGIEYLNRYESMCTQPAFDDDFELEP